MTKEYVPWESHPDIWKTPSAYLSFVRGGIRRGLWMRNPIRIKYMNSVKRQIPNPSTRKGAKPTVFGATCEICKNEFPMSKIEIDHIDGNHSLKSLDDISTFISSIVMVDTDDLQAVCKECHSIKSYSDKNNISMEEAEAIKKAIAIMNSKKEKEWLGDRGITPASTQKNRRIQVEEALLNELKQENK